ncbi:MAG: hypothetical protein P4N24_06190 [Acidobacteriota bacterium]|nr:hypothetical protein [Acidobacteriota bacterium]
MFGSSVLDIAIGIVFVFLLLSLAASTLNEMILTFIGARGKELLRGLKTLLNDDKAEGLVKDIYNHGLVYGLFQGEFDPRKGGNLPSYIPPRNFAVALIDVVAPSTAVQQDEKAMMDSLRAAALKLAVNETTAKVGKPLIAIIDAAGADAAKVRKGIEDWYNSAMDRVSGWYKKRTQYILLGLGVLLAFGLNVDTVVVVRHLSNDATLRQSLVAAAQEEAKKPSADQTGNPKSPDADFSAIKSTMADVQTLGLPIGWLTAAQVTKKDGSIDDPDDRAWPPSNGYLRVVRIHFWGWLITAVAVSLGAPFWFDMLNKIMVVRSSIKPGEKSQEEPAKDKS